jgi:hypothetical protein
MRILRTWLLVGFCLVGLTLGCKKAETGPAPSTGGRAAKVPEKKGKKLDMPEFAPPPPLPGK